jgi:hypothetical protein
VHTQVTSAVRVRLTHLSPSALGEIKAVIISNVLWVFIENK